MIVMKFGGTSVEDAQAIERVAAIVKDRLPQKPVVVVSAMAKVTDTLLAMARAAGAGERKTALKLCRSLQERHYNTASELLGTALLHRFPFRTGRATSKASMNCCAAFPPSEKSRPAPPTTSLPSAKCFPARSWPPHFPLADLKGAHVDSREVLVTDSSYTQAVPQQEETNERLRTKCSRCSMPDRSR